MHRRTTLLFAAGLIASRAVRAQAPAPSPSAPAATRRVHGLSLLGEPKLPAGFPHFPWVNPDAPKGGEVSLAALGSYDSFNPYIVRGTPANVVPVWETLMTANADEAATSYGHLAGAIEIPEDRSWAAFELRPEARFHDGRPVTAEDVVWSFETLRDKGRPNFRIYYADVRDAVAEGPRRVVFHIAEPGNKELPQILGDFPVMPKHWWQSRAFDEPLREPPLGSGPYRVGAHELGRSYTLERVADWWGATVPTGRGLYNFNTQRVTYYRDPTAVIQAFKAGQSDYREENVAKDWATAYDFPARTKGLVKLEAVRHHLPTGMQCFAMNTRRPVFADRRARAGLAWLFDFEWANKNLFYGAYTRTRSYFSNSDYACSGLPQGAELALLEPHRAALPAELFTQEFALPVTDGSGNDRAQLRQAYDMLRAAGWQLRDRRMLDAAGKPVEFEILVTQPTFERVALPYKQSLEKLGIAARVRMADPAQYQHLIDGFDFDMIINLFGESDHPGNEQREYWGSQAAAQPGSNNLIGVADPVVDALVAAVVQAPDLDHLLPATRALDRVLLWNWYSVPQWHLQVDRIAYWDRFGRPEAPVRPGVVFDSWWIDPARAAATDAARRPG